MKKLLIIFVFSIVCSTHAQTTEKETLAQLNKTVVSLFQKNKLDEALKNAVQAVDLSTKVYGAEHVETASAYTNLGVIHRARKKFDKSIENFEKAADIYEKIPGYKNEKFVSIYNVLANAQVLNGRKKEAEINYLKAVETAENIFGKESKESLPPTLQLAEFYAFDKNYEKSNDIYLKGYAVAVKNFSSKSIEIERIDDARSCAVGPVYNSANNGAFNEAKKKILGGTTTDGKAKLLPKPRYPTKALEQKLGGSVSIRVEINEQGDVRKSKVVCGHPILAAASEEAAKNAKFEPTIMDGKPVKVSGILVYNFAP